MAEKDMTEKSLEAFQEVFADILNGFLFGGEMLVQEGALEKAGERSVYKAERGLREQERDIAKYWNGVNFHIAFLGIENETAPEKDMPLRVIGYDGAAYRDQIYDIRDEKGKRKRNHNPRYPVVTLVLYFGYKKHWDKPVTLYGALGDIPEKLKQYVSDYKVNVFEVAWLSDEQVANFKSDFRIVADYFVQMRKNREYIPNDIRITHVREVMQLMSALTRDDRFEMAYDVTEEGEEVGTMNEWLDRAINRGISKGLQEGRKEGRILEYIELRREDGYSDEKLAEGLIRKFHLTAEDAQRYVKEPQLV